MSEIELVLGGVLAACAIAVVVIIRLQRGIKEGRELYEAIKAAMADGNITKEEMDLIFREARDVASVALSLASLINKR